MFSIFIISLALANLFLLVYFYTSSYFPKLNNQHLRSFECGFDPLTQPRKPFSTRYFLLILIFLVFDVEAVLLFPILAKIILHSNPNLLATLLAFLLLLLLGLLLEWAQGVLQ